MSAAASGTLFVPMIFAMISASVASGQIVSRTGRYKLLAVGGAVLATAGMALLARLGASGTATTILWCLVVCGFGFGAAQPVYALVVQNAAPRAQLGAATATSQFFRSIGSTIGVAVFGTLLLGIYHQRLAASLPADTPADVRAVVDNPLTMNQAGTRGRGAGAAAADRRRPWPPACAPACAAGMQRIFDLAALVMATLGAAEPAGCPNCRCAHAPTTRRRPTSPDAVHTKRRVLRARGVRDIGASRNARAPAEPGGTRLPLDRDDVISAGATQFQDCTKRARWPERALCAEILGAIGTPGRPIAKALDQRASHDQRLARASTSRRGWARGQTPVKVGPEAGQTPCWLEADFVVEPATPSVATSAVDASQHFVAAEQAEQSRTARGSPCGRSSPAAWRG